MSKAFVVLGDKTDHGGAVVSVSSMTDINGQPVARHGDKTACGATLLAGRLVFAGALLSLTTGCFARQKMHEGVVRQAGELPCFSVPPGDFRPDSELRVRMVEVSQINAGSTVIATPGGAFS